MPRHAYAKLRMRARRNPGFLSGWSFIGSREGVRNLALYCFSGMSLCLAVLDRGGTMLLAITRMHFMLIVLGQLRCWKALASAADEHNNCSDGKKSKPFHVSPRVAASQDLPSKECISCRNLIVDAGAA